MCPKKLTLRFFGILVGCPQNDKLGRDRTGFLNSGWDCRTLNGDARTFVSRHKLATFVVISLLLAAVWPALATSKRKVLRSSNPALRQPLRTANGSRDMVCERAGSASGCELDAAEAAFRQVLVADPRAGSAYCQSWRDRHAA